MQGPLNGGEARGAYGYFEPRRREARLYLKDGQWRYEIKIWSRKNTPEPPTVADILVSDWLDIITGIFAEHRDVLRLEFAEQLSMIGDLTR